MSNQNVTVNRVTLLESIEAAQRSAIVCISMHWAAMSAPIPFLMETIVNLYDKVLIEAAILEAWGNGP